MTANRTADVLAAMAAMPAAGTASSLARVLNFDAPCPWCPVGPPRKTTHADGSPILMPCASVPESSRREVEKVLRALVRAGAVERIPCFRKWMYVRKDMKPLLGL